MARGHHYHMRVVINGHYAYNRGGDACKNVLRDIDRCNTVDRVYDPLNSQGMRESFGLHYNNMDGVTIGVRHSEVETIRLIFISRTRVGRRKIKMICDYYYRKGTMTHHVTIPGTWLLYEEDSDYYRNIINTEPIERMITVERPDYMDALEGQLPGQNDSYKTLRAMAHAHTEATIERPYLTADEIYHMDAKRKQFLMDMTKHFRAGGTVGGVSDGYHTYDELYHHRALLFAAICNSHPELAWKSKQHDDPESPMFEGMFICGITTPQGQATYHYDLNPYWDMFHVPELERAPKFDGHTPEDAINRIFSMFPIEE